MVGITFMVFITFMGDTGDYLTFECHKEAQSAMQDARTPSSRLEGLIPKIEDFHNQAE